LLNSPVETALEASQAEREPGVLEFGQNLWIAAQASRDPHLEALGADTMLKAVLRRLLGYVPEGHEAELARDVLGDLGTFQVGLTELVHKGEGTTAEWAAVLGSLYLSVSTASESRNLVQAGAPLFSLLYQHFTPERQVIHDRLQAMAVSERPQKDALESLAVASPWGDLSFREALRMLTKHLQALRDRNPLTLVPWALAEENLDKAAAYAARAETVSAKLNDYARWTEPFLLLGSRLQGSAGLWVNTVTMAIWGAEGMRPKLGLTGPYI
jgi:hypothetical protein